MTATANSEKTAKRNGNLKPWKPGQSGNPAGRPRKVENYVRELVGGDGKKLVDFMLAILDDESEPTARRIEAAQCLFDRGFGKPQQNVSVTDGDQHTPAVLEIEDPDTMAEFAATVAEIGVPDAPASASR